MRTDSKTLEAYKRVGRTPDGRVMQSHLAAELDGVKRMLLSAPAERVSYLQARGALLEELVGLLQENKAAK